MAGTEDDYGHRHFSHGVTVFSYHEITREDTPELFQAASIVLARKDKARIVSGHGILHSALIAADINQNESARDRSLRFTREDFYYGGLLTSYNPNHDTFCTDVAHTVPTIMMEMLVTSSPGKIELLPALPRDLESGMIDGVKGRNRVTIQSLH